MTSGQPSSPARPALELTGTRRVTVHVLTALVTGFALVSVVLGPLPVHRLPDGSVHAPTAHCGFLPVVALGAAVLLGWRAGRPALWLAIAVGVSGLLGGLSMAGGAITDPPDAMRSDSLDVLLRVSIAGVALASAALLVAAPAAFLLERRAGSAGVPRARVVSRSR